MKLKSPHTNCLNKFTVPATCFLNTVKTPVLLNSCKVCCQFHKEDKHLSHPSQDKGSISHRLKKSHMPKPHTIQLGVSQNMYMVGT